MLGIEPRFIGWGITTSWLDECIANLGWPGVLIGPLVLGLMCRFGHRARDPQSDAATVIVTVLFLTVQAGAFLPVILVWLVHLVRTRKIAVPQDRGSLPHRAPSHLQPQLVLATPYTWPGAVTPQGGIVTPADGAYAPARSLSSD